MAKKPVLTDFHPEQRTPKIPELGTVKFTPEKAIRKTEDSKLFGIRPMTDFLVGDSGNHKG